MKKHSLDQFIGLLMHDDNALNAFLADPTNGGAEHGITKAERAVLRRTVAHLSNVSRNGYGVQRDLGSYRRSLRLLQNVLHQHVGAHQQVNAGAQAQVEATSGPTFYVYLTGDPSNPGAPYTDPAKAYTTYVTFQGSSGSTIGDAMDFDSSTGKPTGSFTGHDMGGNQVSITYTAVKGSKGGYVLDSFTITGGDNPGTYYINYDTLKGRDPFWFYSLDGQAVVFGKNGPQENDDASFGGLSEPFNTHQLNGAQTVYWQAIAPDTTYGFAPCFPYKTSSYQLGKSYAQVCYGVTKGEKFYTNTVTNVTIDSTAQRWILSSTPDGTGHVSTDDVVTIQIEVAGSGQKTTLYTHDFSNGCSGVITPIDQVDITSNLAKYSGEIVNFYITYQDQCGGCISSTAYYLVGIFST
ncbi:MAG: hypothetical protein AAF617_13515 [Bacteroidota bacterium]